jgi:hypothetical protein
MGQFSVETYQSRVTSQWQSTGRGLTVISRFAAPELQFARKHPMIFGVHAGIEFCKTMESRAVPTRSMKKKERGKGGD